ncbi:MAG: cytochrome c biogenesis protein CcsA [Syntrophobacterales bacterium]|nr:cytochrome c biogenesis protein CcsA [Syntrophobacterales bacterium]
MAALLTSLILLAYVGGTAAYLAYVFVQREGLSRGGAGCLAAGWLAHTGELLRRYLTLGHLPMATPGEALFFFSWTLTAVFLVLTWRFPIRILGALVAPLAALMAAALWLLPSRPGTISPLLSGFWLHLHVLLALLGTAALTLAGLGGVLYLLQERQLKQKKFGFFYRRLPSLTQLDRLNHWCLTLGFPLLTLGIITGSLYAQLTLGRFFNWDPKEILTLIAWLIYTILLHERLTVGWRGRRAAWLAVGGLGVMVLAFVGASLWFSGYHSFGSFRTP